MNEIVQLTYPLDRGKLHSDHGYGLYAALSKTQPSLHGLQGLSLITVPGKAQQNGLIEFEQSWFGLRLPLEFLPEALKLANQSLEVNGFRLNVGVPQVNLLQPCPELKARVVAIRSPNDRWRSGCVTDPKIVLEVCERRLKAMGIEAKLFIPARESGNPKRIAVRIKDRVAAVGYTVIAQIKPEDSIQLQAEGLGCYRRMGMGVFKPLMSAPSRGVTNATTTTVC